METATATRWHFTATLGARRRTRSYATEAEARARLEREQDECDRIADDYGARVLAYLMEDEGDVEPPEPVFPDLAVAPCDRGRECAACRAALERGDEGR